MLFCFRIYTAAYICSRTAEWAKSISSLFWIKKGEEEEESQFRYMTESSSAIKPVFDWQTLDTVKKYLPATFCVGLTFVCLESGQ